MRWRAKLESMGYHLSQDELKEVFGRFKELADKKKTVTEVDLEALVGEWALPAGRSLEPARGAGALGTAMTPTAVVKLKESVSGEVELGAAIGQARGRRRLSGD
jgi:2-isopropylmalate synthase